MKILQINTRTHVHTNKCSESETGCMLNEGRPVNNLFNKPSTVPVLYKFCGNSLLRFEQLKTYALL